MIRAAHILVCICLALVGCRTLNQSKQLPKNAPFTIDTKTGLPVLPAGEVPHPATLLPTNATNDEVNTTKRPTENEPRSKPRLVVNDRAVRFGGQIITEKRLAQIALDYVLTQRGTEVGPIVYADINVKAGVSGDRAKVTLVQGIGLPAWDAIIDSGLNVVQFEQFITIDEVK